MEKNKTDRYGVPEKYGKEREGGVFCPGVFMDTYTVLLADDEDDVIQVMIRKIEWEKLGFTVLGYANNGVKALEMAEELTPDVILTDIKMPYMDGLELAKNIKDKYPETKILIFTGFDEFEYAKEAVHLEIEEYILKPLNASELTDIFERLKKKLDSEIDEKRNMEVLQKHYMESLPLLQADFFTSLIEGRLSRADLPKLQKDYRLDFEGNCFCTVIVHTSAAYTSEVLNPLMMSASVKNLLEEYTKERWRWYSFQYLGNTVLIVQLKREQEISELTDVFDRFCRYVKKVVGAVVTVGIGRVQTDLLQLEESYTGAREALSYRAMLGSAKAINIEEIVPGQTESQLEQKENSLTKLLKAVQIGAEKDVLAEVNEYVEGVKKTGMSLETYHITLMDMIGALHRFAGRYAVDCPQVSGNVMTLFMMLADKNTEELKAWLTETALSLKEEFATARNRSTRSFVTRAKDYVADHYGEEDVSLDTVCEQLGVSKAYFSTIFKKETGTNFIGYLTEYRMKVAGRLLIETDEKSYVIANRVGYTDPNYFSYVFKRSFGVSPSKYRAQNGD